MTRLPTAFLRALKNRRLLAPVAFPLLLGAAPAEAELMLSKVILDLGPDSAPRDDIELWNDGEERLYVVGEPSEIVDAGLPTELRKPSPDPAVTGLLVTPQKLILEPGEHKLVRIAAVAVRPAKDRIYRVTIKPIAGPITAERSALKLFVGYDVLVILRPPQLEIDLTASRHGDNLEIRNRGNTNVELTQGRQCDPSGENCRDLAANRIYPGASWTIGTPYRTPVTFRTSAPGQQGSVEF